MGFLRNDENFLKNTLVREAINYVVSEIQKDTHFIEYHKVDVSKIDKKLVGQVILDYFVQLKQHMIDQKHYLISMYCFGKFRRKLSATEKAVRQLEAERLQREKEFMNYE